MELAQDYVKCCCLLGPPACDTTVLGRQLRVSQKLLTYLWTLIFWVVKSYGLVG